MRWGKYLLLILAFTYLFPHVLSAEELTEKQLRLKGLRSFKLVVSVGGGVPINKEDLKKEAYVYLKSRMPKILLVDRNHDAALVIAIDIIYSKYTLGEKIGYSGSINVGVLEWLIPARHLNDFLSVEENERIRYEFFGEIWYSAMVFSGGGTEVRKITNHLIDIMKSPLRDFVYDYYKANPGE